MSPVRFQNRAMTWDIRRIAARLRQFTAAGPPPEGNTRAPGAQQAP
jgi:hypothetical protein